MTFMLHHHKTKINEMHMLNRLVELIVLNIGHDAGVLTDQSKFLRSFPLKTIHMN